MMGAIIAHVTKIGFDGDMGRMGFMAILVFASSLTVLYLRRRQLPVIGRMFGE